MPETEGETVQLLDGDGGAILGLNRRGPPRACDTMFSCGERQGHLAFGVASLEAS